MKIDSERLQHMEKLAFDLDAKLPLRIWVEGDGTIYGEFQGNENHRRQLGSFEVIKLIHQTAHTCRRMISI